MDQLTFVLLLLTGAMGFFAFLCVYQSQRDEKIIHKLSQRNRELELDVKIYKRRAQMADLLDL